MISRRFFNSTKNYAYLKFNGKCARCGSEDNLEYDHFIPVYLGGKSTKENIVLLCQDCNRKKFNKLYCPICLEDLIDCVCKIDDINDFIDSKNYIREEKKEEYQIITEDFIKQKNKLYRCRCYLFCNYVLLEKTSIQIAKECGICDSTIKIWLRKFNIRINLMLEKGIKEIEYQQCQFCGMMKLKETLKQHESGCPERSINKLLVICEDCGKIFNRLGLRAHKSKCFNYKKHEIIEKMIIDCLSEKDFMSGSEINMSQKSIELRKKWKSHTNYTYIHKALNKLMKNGRIIKRHRKGTRNTLEYVLLMIKNKNM